MGEEASVKALYNQMYEAMIQKDKAALEEILAQQFELRHMSGMQQNKTAYIDSILNGTLNYYSKEDVEIHVDITGNNASLTGKSIVEAAVFSGSKAYWNLALSMKAEKINHHWQFVFATASLF